MRTILLSTAVADGAPQIVWDAPSECPSEEDVRTAIEDLVGAPMDAHVKDRLRVEARIRPMDTEWSMHLRIETASGIRSRELTAPSCGKLADIAVVVIAVAIDPVPVQGETALGEDVEPIATQASEPLAREHSAAAEPPRTTHRETLQGAITLGGAFGVGALPGPTGAFVGAGAMVWPRARGELGVTAWVPRTQRWVGTAAETNVGVWHIDARGCGVPKVKRIEFPLCLGVELGAMTGRGRGLAHTERRRLPWFALEGSATVIAPVASHLSVFMATRLVVPLLRPGFELDGVEVHRTSSAAFAATVGLEIRWILRDVGRPVPHAPRHGRPWTSRPRNRTRRTTRSTDFRSALHDGGMSRDETPDDEDRLSDLAAVYRAHQDYVARILHHVGLEPTLVDDALQDVFLVAHRRLGDFDGRASIRAWLYGIAKRVASDYRRGTRRGSRRLTLLGEEHDDLLRSEHAGARVEAAHLVEQFLERLDVDKRRMFLLSELEGMTAVEIAELEGLNVNTVYARLRAVRKSFERAVERHLVRSKREGSWTG